MKHFVLSLLLQFTRALNLFACQCYIVAFHYLYLIYAFSLCIILADNETISKLNLSWNQIRIPGIERLAKGLLVSIPFKYTY